MKIDRAGWGPGPWDGEPDRIEFEHAGLPCLMRRVAATGAWCGYVAVPPGHPDHGKSWGDADVEVEVHGGLTYSGPRQGDICHVPKPGEPDDVHWFGFDCAHARDLMPAIPHRGETYRDQHYVRGEVESLAEQLARRRA